MASLRSEKPQNGGKIKNGSLLKLNSNLKLHFEIIFSSLKLKQKQKTVVNFTKILFVNFIIYLVLVIAKNVNMKI